MARTKFVANPRIAQHCPQLYASMGQTAENVAQAHGVSREAQDAFSLRSRRRAVADEGHRRDSTLEALARLKPAFVEGGTVTAGNPSRWQFPEC